MKHLTFIVILFGLFSISSCKNQPKQSLVIWYDKPALSWMTEALPIGNGYMGAVFFGGITKEEIQFTEESLWTGGPKSHPDYNFGNRDSAYRFLPAIRHLLQENKFSEAATLTQEQLTSRLHFSYPDQYFGDFGAQQTMGSLYISLTSSIDSVSNYKRGINISEGRGFVNFTTGTIKHHRSYFGNYPDKIMVYRYETSSPLSYFLVFQSPHLIDFNNFSNNILSFKGHLADNQMQFQTSFRISSDGNTTYCNDTLWIKDATFFDIAHTAATSYKNEYPTYEGNNPQLICEQTLSNIQTKTYSDFSKTQLTDYQNLFNRVEIELGEGKDELPTDLRLQQYAQGTPDLGLEELYFQYGRYLMISASRPNTLPMNLQGKWNNSTRPPWACDYHFNINVQMLYWAAEITNLPECHQPLMNFIEHLVAPGRVSAQKLYGTRGWITNVMTNVFGYTGTGQSIEWGVFPAGAAWACRHLWEHYLYNQDTAFLKNKALPIMKEAALFWMDYLIDDGNGKLVSCPSFSPEHGGISKGASMDHQIASDVMSNCIQAYKVLSLHDSFLDSLIVIHDRICPPEIGRWKQLKEWREDVDDPNNKHRHVSHLYALFPAHLITVTNTPALAEAAKVSLNARGDDGTGWSLAWKINFWARLQDGNRAYSLLQKLLRPISNTGYNMLNEGGTYNNLWCAHPPFQLDGNMGAVSGIAEMLLNPIEEKPLPALPTAWKKGFIKGLKTQSGKTVDIYWDNHQLTKMTIR